MYYNDDDDFQMISYDDFAPDYVLNSIVDYVNEQTSIPSIICDEIIHILSLKENRSAYIRKPSNNIQMIFRGMNVSEEWLKIATSINEENIPNIGEKRGKLLFSPSTAPSMMPRLYSSWTDS
jgi:hypothetical protein